MMTPTLETERIIIRPLKIADAEAVYNNWSSDPEVTKYMRYNTHRSVSATIEWLTSVEANYSSEKACDSSKNAYDWGFVFKETEELFGSGGLCHVQEHGLFEPGYNIMKKYWSLGLATEAAGAMVDFAAESLGVNAMFARHNKENPASGRVMEKLGFVRTGSGTNKKFDGRIYETWEYILRIDSAQ